MNFPKPREEIAALVAREPTRPLKSFIKIEGCANIDIVGDAVVSFDVLTIEQAAIVLREAYKGNKDFSDAVIKTIESALKEANVGDTILATKIAERVFGDG